MLNGYHTPGKGSPRHKEDVAGVSNFCTLFSEVMQRLWKLSPYFRYSGQSEGAWINADHSPLVSSSTECNGPILPFYIRVVFFFSLQASVTWQYPTQ